MIEIKNVEKSFGTSKAVNNVTLNIAEGEVFGLVGTNGAGKSTLLRMITGVIKPDKGTITIDGLPVYDNPEAKKLFVFIPDEAYFFPNTTPLETGRIYAKFYENFDLGRYRCLIRDFGLPEHDKIAQFSKGMKRQLSLLLGICAGTKYLICDETFDGLDPVMRQAVKSLLAQEMSDRGLTPLITSHNLRELEDICDHVGLLHYGGVLMSKDLADIKVNIQKIQAVFHTEESRMAVEKQLKIMIHKVQGKVHTYTVRGTREDIEKIFANADTTFYEVLGLSLEEIFISETEVVGYDIKKFILG